MPTDLTFNVNQDGRTDEGLIVVASGNQSRNRDYWTGKPYRLIPSGMRLENWLKNGQVLWMHSFNIPLGTSDLFVRQGKLMAQGLRFHRKKVPIATQNWIGDAIGEFDTAVIADLWDEGWLRAVSVHVMLRPEDEAAMIEDDLEIIFPTSEVIEWSLVTIPADEDAVKQRMLAMGLQPALCDGLVCPQSSLVQPQITLSISNGAASPELAEGAVVSGVEVNMNEEFDEVEEVEEEAEEIETETVEEELFIDQESAVQLAKMFAEMPEAMEPLREALGIREIEESLARIEANQAQQARSGPVRLVLQRTEKQEEAPPLTPAPKKVVTKANGRVAKSDPVLSLVRKEQ